jgi:hypothetical protein
VIKKNEKNEKKRQREGEEEKHGPRLHSHSTINKSEAIQYLIGGSKPTTGDVTSPYTLADGVGGAFTAACGEYTAFVGVVSNV